MGDDFQVGKAVLHGVLNHSRKTKSHPVPGHGTGCNECKPYVEITMMHQSSAGYILQKLNISMGTCLFESFTASFCAAFSSGAHISIYCCKAVDMLHQISREGDSSSTRRVGKSLAYPTKIHCQIDTISLLKHYPNQIARKLEMLIN